MIPVLFQFGVTSTASLWLMYALAVGIAGYAAWSGWRNGGTQNAITYGIGGAVLARIGLYYALPAQYFLGGKGQGIPIHTYGIMLAGGFIAAVTIASQMAAEEWRGEEGERKRDQIYDLAFWVFLSGVGGSKVLFVIVNWSDYSGHIGEYFSSPLKLVDCLGGGLVFYGGLIGASIASYIYAKKHKFDFLRLADLAIPTVSLGQCLGRLGCFSAGCCWGDIGGAGLHWGIHFPGAALARNVFGNASHTASLAYQSQSTDARYVVEATGEIFHQFVPGSVKISEWVAQHGHTLPVHPTQLYESIGQFLLFVGLVFLRRHRRFHGQIFALWLMCYAVLRSTVELFRGDVERGTLHGLLTQLGMSGAADKIPLEAWFNVSTSQFISLCMFSFGAALLYRRGRAVWSRDAGAAAPAAA